MENETPFSVSRHTDRDAVVVTPVGDVDLATADAVRAELRAAMGEARTVVLDLRGVTFMDSSGLRLLVEMQRATDADGIRMVVVRGPASLQRLLDLTGVEGRVPMADDVEQAVRGDDPATG
jgi:anti-sigma B factor antagonist